MNPREGERWVTRVPDATAMEALGARIGRVLRVGDWIALTGPLGAGKTTLVRGLARGLGAGGRVASPTFTLMHVYRGRIPLFHLDLYRLEGALSLADVADPDELAAEGAVAVEWADRAPDWLAPDALWVAISGPGSEPGRRVAVEARGPRARELLAALRAKAADDGGDREGGGQPGGVDPRA
ncbi:MAG TPA: tRNA (adenosine(37)-N6)-threonylcarbamoyltransferase complex ATPase subunit type 1 TsaE [Thermaerobacter sp.]